MKLKVQQRRSWRLNDVRRGDIYKATSLYTKYNETILLRQKVCLRFPSKLKLPIYMIWNVSKSKELLFPF